MVSPHFKLSEFLVSDSHPDLAAKLEPDPVQLDNLRLLATSLLEPIRNHLEGPLAITSGLRSLELNSALGGSATSQHLHGEAADIVIPNQPKNAIWNLFQWLRLESKLPFCQLIIYRSESGVSFWKGNIHISIASQGGHHPNGVPIPVPPRVLVHDAISPGPPAPYWQVEEWLKMRRQWGA
jgi:hypothetical protein